MTERGKGNTTLEKHTLLKEKVVSEFESALKDFRENKINSYGLLGQVGQAWRAAHANHALRQKIQQKMREKRKVLEEVLGPCIDSSKHQDPIVRRYNPYCWHLPEFSQPNEKKGEKEEETRRFLEDRTQALIVFFESL